MRISLIGQALFGARVLEGLLQKNEEVVAAFTPPDKTQGPLDPLKSVALANQIQVFQPHTYKEEQVFVAYKELKLDLTILAFVPRIIPARYLKVPIHEAICYHPSILPRHRGASAINWALIMGDTRTGLTIFWPDAGIDTGPILLQREIEIGPDDTAATLYFNHLFPLGIAAILESVDLIKKGRAPRIAQDDEKATYEPPCDDRVAEVDWAKPAAEMYNLIRGCDPQPGAYTFWRGEKIRFYGARFLEESIAEKPGTIVQIDSNGLHIAAHGGKLVVGKIHCQATGKVKAADFVSAHQLKAGDRIAGA
jgi:methionyl-tRNA formyltransferase